MKRSAGILLYRRRSGELEVLLAHPGGPLWSRRDEGAWSIPKGELAAGEDVMATARREFLEETGHAAPEELIPLGRVVQRGGKQVDAWAGEGDLAPKISSSNTFEMEWPPRSGRVAEFPEIDRIEWFSISTARGKANPAQVEFLDRLVEAVG